MELVGVFMLARAACSYYLGVRVAQYRDTLLFRDDCFLIAPNLKRIVVPLIYSSCLCSSCKVGWFAELHPVIPFAEQRFYVSLPSTKLLAK